MKKFEQITERYITENQLGFKGIGSNGYTFQYAEFTSRITQADTEVTARTIVHQFTDELKKFSSSTLEKGIVLDLAARLNDAENALTNRSDDPPIETNVQYDPLGHFVSLVSSMALQDLTESNLHHLLHSHLLAIDECIFLLTLNAKQGQDIVKHGVA